VFIFGRAIHTIELHAVLMCLFLAERYTRLSCMQFSNLGGLARMNKNSEPRMRAGRVKIASSAFHGILVSDSNCNRMHTYCNSARTPCEQLSTACHSSHQDPYASSFVCVVFRIQHCPHLGSFALSICVVVFRVLCLFSCS
jgi:hypothetical protein